MARFTERILVRCQPALVRAIDRAAAKNLMTVSEYIRRSIIEHLKADGNYLRSGLDSQSVRPKLPPCAARREPSRTSRTGSTSSG
jgi:hypothetical protein